MNNFKLIQEHFTHLHCPYCDKEFTSECINLIREEVDYWVVKVFCVSCNQSVGIAIVGIEVEQNKTYKQYKQKESDFNSDELKKFSNKQPITTNEVLDAHKFIQNLGSDWTKYIGSR